nr:NERD domain-containing protein/DEAD/DEAH box helicase [Anaerolineae bacterium]
METPKLNDCLILFLKLLARGDRLTREQIRETMWQAFGAETDDDKTDINRLVGLCDSFLGRARLITKIPMPKHPEHDEFEITPQGTRMAHLHASAEQLVTMSYVRELVGSKILRGDGSDFAKSWSEWEFFDVLEPLTDDYIIFHSVSWRGRNGGTEGEIDFLIVHPQKGVLVLEVKGGIIGVRRQGTKLAWYSRKKNTPAHEYPIDPVAQARRNSQALREWLRSDPRTKSHRYAIFYAVAFPDSEVLADIGLHIPTDIIVDMRHLDDLRGRIDAIFAYHWQNPIEENKVMGGDDAVVALRALILPTKNLAPRLSTVFAKERRKIDQFTERQMNILRILRYHHQAVILGGAGTGKTLIAFEKAMRLAQEGQKVLFLGYNKGLVEWARRVLQHPNITIETLHSLVAKVMNWVGWGDKISKSHGEFDKQITDLLRDSILELRQSDELIEKHCFD